MKTTIYSALILAQVLAMGSCGPSKANSGSERKEENKQEVFVKVEKIQLRDFSETIRLTGFVESLNNIIVPSEEGGRLMEWKTEKGAYVRKGQVLAQIDDAMMKASHDAALANYNMANVNYEKQKAAFEEQAVSALQLKNLEYQRDAAKAQLDMAKLRWERTAVRSPIDGIVNEHFVKAGEMIAPGMPISQVIDVEQMKVMVGVPERYTKDLRLGTVVEFTVDAFPNEVFSGKLTFIGAAVNPDNRTLPAEIYFTNAGGHLKPQMIAAVQLKLATTTKAVMISQDYIQQVDMNKLIVYVAKDGVADERLIKLGGSDGTFVRVVSGLQEGDRLITVGFQNLIDKQKIRVQE
jgi:membrane fusion protein (multidrug efflux system)